MSDLDPGAVRAALATLSERDQRVVIGLVGSMMSEPARVRDREWVGERLSELALACTAGEAATPEQGLSAVQAFVAEHGERLLRAAFLLFQRVGLDLAERAKEGFSFEEALRGALAYLPAGAALGESDAPGRTSNSVDRQGQDAGG